MIVQWDVKLSGHNAAFPVLNDLTIPGPSSEFGFGVSRSAACSRNNGRGAEALLLGASEYRVYKVFLVIQLFDSKGYFCFSILV